MELIKPTPELKARFFAHHLGQNVSHGKYDLTGKEPTITGVLDSGIFFSSGKTKSGKDVNIYAVVLKPLSQITDEDAIEVKFKNGIPNEWELFKVYSHAPGTWVSIKLRKKYSENEIHFNEDGYKYEDNFITFYNITAWESQCLQYKGYAVPFMGISVETLIEWGWIKLQTT